jgi:chitinase
MIGQNDNRNEIFTVANAKGLTTFASAQHLGRVSMWSVNRDSQCGSAFAQTGLLSNTCSGTTQSGLQFSKVLGGLGGSATATSSAGDVQPAVANTNPADAPYPQWSATADYPSGYKVAEDGEIYQSKWYNIGDDPQAQVQYSWQSAWELLGPVLPGDHAPVTAKPPAGTYPAWSINTEYHAGNRVLFAGLPYQAKWNNQGTAPQAGTGSSGSPWQSLETIPGEPTPSASATP